MNTRNSSQEFSPGATNSLSASRAPNVPRQKLIAIWASKQLFLMGMAAASLLFSRAASAQALDPWETIDDFQYAPGFGAGALDIGADPFGNLFVVGFGITDSSTRLGVLRESTDPSL